MHAATACAAPARVQPSPRPRSPAEGWAVLCSSPRTKFCTGSTPAAGVAAHAGAGKHVWHEEQRPPRTRRRHASATVPANPKRPPNQRDNGRKVNATGTEKERIKQTMSRLPTCEREIGIRDIRLRESAVQLHVVPATGVVVTANQRRFAAETSRRYACPTIPEI